MLRSARALVGFSLRQALGAGPGGQWTTRALASVCALVAFAPALTVIALPPLAERLLPRVDPNLELETIREYAANPAVILDFTRYLATMTAPLILATVFLVPDLVGRDRRGGLLRPYLRSPLGATGYVIAKMTAAASVVFVVAGGPLLLIVAGHRITGRDDFGAASAMAALGRAAGAGAVVAVAYGALGIAAGALASRRLSASGAVAVALVAAPAVTGYLVDGVGAGPVIAAADPTQAALALATRIAGGAAMAGVTTVELAVLAAAWTLSFATVAWWAVTRP